MIRPLSPADIDAYKAIREESLQLNSFSFGSAPEESPNRQQTLERLTLKHDEDFILGKFVEQELVGLIGFVRNTRVKSDHIASIWGMYVKAAYRGQGFAQQLMQACLEKAIEIEGLKKVKLSVTNYAPQAQKLYEAVGFEAYAQEEDALRWNGHSMTEIFMEKLLY